MDQTTERYTVAETLSAGDLMCEGDGFLLRVVAVGRDGNRVTLTLEPVYGSMTWPEGERRTQRIGRRRMVRVP